MLEKSTRLILLHDFYQDLLTEKQKQYMELYFQDDFSLGEIAEEFGISRQAVYEHIKRSENLLEEYEGKLQLLAKYEQRTKILEEMEQLIDRQEGEFLLQLKEKINLLRQID
ncbi:putative DNA-binding protein [Tepidibacillus infernus]|uniref:UPF0122 protein U473_06405 n=1 Tax=Tepidibacillus decaturensis TaxID=1413211 RepID=A0A135L3R2_9BACI|nr:MULTISPECIES: putative DNA-binding protein [Tepidibacillus]KXG43688.1 hypothetical protein U473_06405 [Tepidibacillus decaturensis]GBF11642.1 putative DNA-binding protein [Tepidibacillus sp. HK-1]